MQAKGYLSYSLPPPSVLANSVCQLDRIENHRGDKLLARLGGGHLDWLEVGRCILLLGTCRLHHSMVWATRLDEKEADKLGVYNIHLCFLTVDTR